MANTAVIAGTAIGGFFLIFFLIWIGMMILGILGFVLWILMIIDVAKRKFKQENNKVMWILIIVLTGIIGAIIYYFMVKKPNKH